jgi:ribose/xylose/arabinose/galactoside ABC-type transport system permease subunit
VMAPATAHRDGGVVMRLARTTEFRLLIALCVLCAVFAVAYPSPFATVGNLENMARVGGILLVVSIGQMFALLVGGFDLSVAANMGFVSVVTALGMTEYGGLVPGIALGLLAGAAIGAVNGALIAGFGLSPFIVTLGMLTFLLGFGNVLSHGAPLFGFPESYHFMAANNWGPVPAPLAIGAIVLIATWVLASKLRAGLYIYAIGGSRETALASGIAVVRYEVLAYTVCGALAGVAGMMELSRVAIGYVTNGTGYELLSVAAAVIGGTVIGGGAGTLTGVVLGVALLTALTTGLDIAGMNEFYQRMAFGAVIVGSVLVSRASNRRHVSRWWRPLIGRPSRLASVGPADSKRGTVSGSSTGGEGAK